MQSIYNFIQEHWCVCNNMSTDCIQYATKNKFTYRVFNEKLLKNTTSVSKLLEKCVGTTRKMHSFQSLKQTPLDNKGLTFLELKWTICQSPLISSFIFFGENLQIATTTFRIVILASVNTRDLPSKQVFLQWHWWLFQETKDRSFFSNLCFRQRVEMLLTFYVKT